MRPTILLVVVASFAISNVARAQQPSPSPKPPVGLQGAEGIPEQMVPGVGLPLYDAGLAAEAGKYLAEMRDAAEKCDRTAYNNAMLNWKISIGITSHNSRTYPNAGTEKGRRQRADADALRKFQENSPLFPEFPVEKCAKKALVDPTPPSPPPPQPPQPQPPIPPGGAKLPGAVTVTHRTTHCAQCQGIANALNQAADNYAAAVQRHDPDQIEFSREMTAYARALDGCEAQCAPVGTVPGAGLQPQPAPPPKAPTLPHSTPAPSTPHVGPAPTNQHGIAPNNMR